MKKLFKVIADIIAGKYNLPVSKQSQVGAVGVGSSLSVVCLVMSAINILQKEYLMAGTTFFLAASFLLVVILYKRNKEQIGNMMALAGVVVLFTFYALGGRNGGFAILWILILPFFMMWSFSLRLGLFIELYFLLLILTMFYTPLRTHMAMYYTENFMNRFPILYIACMIISLFVMKGYYTSQLAQQNHQKKLEQAVLAERQKVTEITMQTIFSISNAVDAKDSYTKRHSSRVSIFAADLARAIGWSEQEIARIRYIGLLHDIGKIGVPDAVLNKPGRLTDEEYELMKQHTVFGGEILKDLSLVPGVDIGAKYHHERYDGKGYPTGLSGTNIPVEARIIGIADAFDAMNSNRVYRKACKKEYIISELERGRGTQFDPDLTDAFITVAKERYLTDE